MFWDEVLFFLFFCFFLNYFKGTATGTVTNTGNGTIIEQIASLASGIGNGKTLIATKTEHFVCTVAKVATSPASFSFFFFFLIYLIGG